MRLGEFGNFFLKSVINGEHFFRIFFAKWIITEIDIYYEAALMMFPKK